MSGDSKFTLPLAKAMYPTFINIDLTDKDFIGTYQEYKFITFSNYLKIGKCVYLVSDNLKYDQKFNRFNFYKT